MKINVLIIAAIAVIFCACGSKKTEGVINYSIEYSSPGQLPDSLKQYIQYLPRQAVVYFKGDSTISIQETPEQATSVITNSKAGFMLALLKSPNKKYAIDYDKAAQAEELAAMPGYTFSQSADRKTIAGYNATRYILKDKQTGDSCEAWFTKDVAIIPSSLTSNLDTTLGVPLAFTLNQGGIIVKTTVTQIKFEPVPAGAFTTPKGYEFLTPRQFKQMTEGN